MKRLQQLISSTLMATLMVTNIGILNSSALPRVDQDIPDGPRPHPGVQPVPEDCTAINPNNLSIERFDNWTHVLDGNNSLFSFFYNYKAYSTVRILKAYGVNKVCGIGRPDASFQYILVNNASPVGPLMDEDCSPFNPNNIGVSYGSDNRWKIAEGSSWLYDFGDNYPDALQALRVIKRYGFTQSCYVGRALPELRTHRFYYLRK